MNNEIIILVISFLILTGMIIFLLIKIKAYRKTLNRILDHMDLAISGTEQEIEYDENIDAAITEKMNKLVNISRLNYEDASRDRDLVKSLICEPTRRRSARRPSTRPARRPRSSTAATTSARSRAATTAR